MLSQSQNLSVVKIKEVLFVGSFQPEIRQQLLYFIAHRRLEFFWKTRTTWSSLKFSGQLRARLDPNYSKWHLQDGSMHCFFPLTSRLWYFFSGMYTTRKWPTSFDFPLLLFLLFSCFLMFSLFFPVFLFFCYSCWPSTGISFQKFPRKHSWDGKSSPWSWAWGRRRKFFSGFFTHIFKHFCTYLGLN